MNSATRYAKIMFKSFQKITQSILTGVAFCSIVTASNFAFAQENTQGIAAIVNDDIITSYDLKQRVLFMLATTGAPNDEASLQRLQSQAMNNLIDERLQIQELAKYDSTVSDESVNRRVLELLQRNGTEPQEMASRLQSVGISMETLRDQVRSEVAWQRIINNVYGARIRITDSQIEEMMDRMTANADKPQYRVTEIFIEATPEINGMEGALVGAEAMITQLQNGAPFQLLARQFSAATSAANGGDIGYVQEGELRPEIDQVIRQMEIGTISTPIQVPGGFYVVALIDKKISESETLYNLRQVTVENEDSEVAMTQLKELKGKLNSCNSVVQDVDAMQDVTTEPMGEIKASDLSDVIISKLEVTEVGQLTDPFERPDGATSIMICKKELTGSGIPTRKQIEDGLTDEQLAQASKRLLRDIRRKATLVLR